MTDIYRVSRNQALASEHESLRRWVPRRGIDHGGGLEPLRLRPA